MIQLQLEIADLIQALAAKGVDAKTVAKHIEQHIMDHGDELAQAAKRAQTNLKRPPWTNPKERKSR